VCACVCVCVRVFLPPCLCVSVDCVHTRFVLDRIWLCFFLRSKHVQENTHVLSVQEAVCGTFWLDACACTTSEDGVKHKLDHYHLCSEANSHEIASPCTILYHVTATPPPGVQCAAGNTQSDREWQSRGVRPMRTRRPLPQMSARARAAAPIESIMPPQSRLEAQM
jgi:hypothetical protein